MVRLGTGMYGRGRREEKQTGRTVRQTELWILSVGTRKILREHLLTGKVQLRIQLFLKAFL